MTDKCIKHSFSMFGKRSESCTNCGIKHPDILAWQRKLVTELESGIQTHAPHPYIALGWWTTTDLKRYMKH